MTTDQETLDRKRRAFAEAFIRALGPVLDDGVDPAAMVGALVLTAGVVAAHHELGDVMQFISGDIERDIDELLRGETH